MNIDLVLEKAIKGERFELTKDHPTSVSFPASEEGRFFVKPGLIDKKVGKDSKVILFSAPGATGKSALANYIAKQLNGVLWDLSKERLGNHSLSGMLVESLGTNSFSKFTEGLKHGKAVLVVDAFDEAEMISGHTAVETLLTDIFQLIQKAESPTVFMFARTETAHFISSYYLKKGSVLSFSHYEISFFAEENSVDFIKGKLQSLGKEITTVTDECIRKQFKEIKRLLGDQTAITSFIGYAPVLETLAISFDEENNTMKLLQHLETSDTGTDIISDILNKLLEREHDKVVCGFSEKCKKDFPDFNDWDKVYTPREQMFYIANMVVFGENDFDGYAIEDIPDELMDDYKESISCFLKEHPFLQNTHRDADNTELDFTGPAFRDFVLANLMVSKDYEDYAISYFGDHKSSSRFPSQMFFDFYVKFSEYTIFSHHFPFLYDAFKSKETVDTLSTIEVLKEETETRAFFAVSSKKYGAQEVDLTVIETDQGYKFNQLNNVDIDICEEIHLGLSGEDVKITNSTIACKKLYFESSNVLIEAYDPGETLIASKEDFDTSKAPGIRFDIRSDNSELRISAPNVASFYKMRQYQYKLDDVSTIDATKFAHALKAILHRFRKHGKDAPGRFADLIDNVIVGSNKLKADILEFLKESGVIYQDSKDPRQYKLDIAKLGEIGINWASFSQTDVNSFKTILNEYLDWTENRG